MTIVGKPSHLRNQFAQRAGDPVKQPEQPVTHAGATGYIARPMTLLPDARPSTCSLAMMASAARDRSGGTLEGRARQFEMAARALVEEFDHVFSAEFVERMLGECVADAVMVTDDPDLVSLLSFRAARHRLGEVEAVRTSALGDPSLAA